ncbi:MlaD family protein [Crenalkalicoccus roseus]|uniref:MlaD family protein n=1 Tax=Crenalkalicoccus roseus TaxID=1485588 RepID=UPI0010809FF8|nr:MlaD family protein [Crenalkalicoccus roseus]
MPQTQRLYLRVGTLVVAGLALAVGFVLFLTADRFARGAEIYETYIQESVQGLDVGAAVRYRGVAVGRVAEIGLVSAEYRRPEGGPFLAAFQRVLVRFTVDNTRIGAGAPSLEEAVRIGLRARLAAQGITGVNYIELDFVDPERFPPPPPPPWTPRFPYIPSIPSTVAQVQDAAQVLLQRLDAADLPGLLANINGFVTELREQTREGELAVVVREAAELLRDLRGEVERADIPATLAELRGVAAEARALLASEEVHATLASAAEAMAELRAAAAGARAVAESEELRQLLANASAAAAELRRAAQRLPATLASIEAGVRTARSASTDLQADLVPILRDMRTAIGNLRDATELLRRYPGQAIFGAPPPPEGRR